MSIYRGPGGSGDAVNDASSEATLVAQLATEAQADADAAAASATAASNSATAAANSATTAASYVPSQTGNSGKYLKTDGTTPSWDDLNISTADISGTLPATNGGTGQSSYAVGDLLFASTTTALSKLADVATGNAVISGGVGVAPSYGKIGLTTHVSGTLPTANGGTNLTSFTANGLLYATSTSALTTGSALTFNGASLAISASDAGAVGGVFVNTNTGTTASAGISGQANSSGLFVLRQYGTGVTGTAFGQTPANYAALVTDGASSNGILIGALTAKPLIFGTNNAERMRLFSSGGLSLGNLTDPGATNLSVTGTIASASTITGTRLISTIATGTAPFTVTSTTQVANLNAATAGTATNQSGGTVSATTLSASGVATFSAGTVSAPAITTTGDTNTGIFFPAADTIAFAEGGAEAMRILSDGNVGIGTTSPQSKLVVSNGGAAGLEFFNVYPGGSVGTFIQSYNRSGAAYVNTAYDALSHAFYISGTERMRIDSAGNIGIGTSSPTTKLDVNGAINIVNTAWLTFTGSNTLFSSVAAGGTILQSPSGADNILFRSSAGTERMRISAAGGVSIGTTVDAGSTNLSVAGFVQPYNGATLLGYIGKDSSITGGTGTNLGLRSETGMSFATGGATERMRITSTGLVGIGIVPSAWSTLTPALQIGAGAFLAAEPSNGTAVYLGANVHFNGTNWIYKTTAAASYYGQSAGQHLWYTAASGTAAATATLTERMRIHASGGVSIGNTTDPGAGNLSVTGTCKFGTTVGVGAATPSASGAGITFPATQSASTDANTLDDYEEGTWTPADASGASLSFTSVTARYTKIGNVVYINAKLTYPTTADVSQAKISGLPFAVGVCANLLIGGNSTSSNSNNAGQGLVDATSTTMTIVAQNHTAKTNVNLTTLTLHISGFYLI